MWQLAAIIIAGLFVVAAYPVLTAAQTATESTAGYDIVTNQNGSKTWTGYKIPRLQDNSGNWKNYVVTEDQNFITVKTNWANTLSYDKVNCSYKVYDPGNIDSAPLLPAVSWTAKSAINGTNTWSPMSVNNQSCSVSVDQSNNEIIITSIKSQDKTEQYVVTTNNATGVKTFANRTVLDQKITHTISITDKIKETIEVYNSASNTKLGATQTINNPNIVLNGQQLNLASSAGQFYNRNWIESNQAKIFQVADSLNYDFDVGFSSLWGVKVNTNSVSLDYNNSPGATNNLVIDPTFTNTGSISGSNVTFTLSYPTLTNAIVSSGDIDGTALSGSQITDLQSKINSATTSWTTTAVNPYTDGLGSNADGTPTNMASNPTTTGKVGSYAWSLDGSNDYVILGSSLSQWNFLHDGSAWTISWWMLDNDRTTEKVILSNNEDVYGINFGHSNNDISWQIWANGVRVIEWSIDNNLIPDTTTWHQYTINYAGNQGDMKVYRDGSLQYTLSSGASSTSTTYKWFGNAHPSSNSNYSMKLGARGNGNGSYLNAKLDEMTFWNRALSSNDISSLYNSGNGATPTASGISLSNLKGYYNFEQTSGNLLNKAATVSSNTLSVTYTTATAPGAPTAVSGSAASTSSVNLSWTAPSSNGGASITDYTIQYSSNSGSTWSTWSHTASTATSQTVTGLSQGTSYIFRVAAVNSVGTGSYSSNSSSVTTWDVPGAPTSVSGSSTLNNQVALSWTAPTSNGGQSITDYVIQYSSNSGSTWTTFADGTSTTTSATVTGLTSNTSYIFRVAAVNSVGTGSYSSNSASVLVRPTTPGAPTALSATVVSTSQIDLTWSQPSDTGGSTITDYTIQYSTDNTTWTTFSDGTSASLSASVTGLSSNTLYYFKVAAVNAQGTGSYSSSTSKATLPNAPTALSGTTVSNTSISLSWTAPTGTATSDYEIKYSSDNITFNTVTDGVSTSTSITLTGLSANQMYYFKVAAVNSAGTGAFSSVAQKQTAPGAPTGLSATVLTSSTVSLSWTAPTGGNQAITDYKIEYSSNSGSTWTTFSDGTSTSTSATVSGLTGTTSYLFRVSAYNAANVSGATSSTASATTYTSGSVTVNLSKTTVGATTRLTWSSSYSGTPSPTFTYTIKDGSATIATQSGTTYYYAHSDKVAHTLQVIASDVNHWNNPSGSDSVSATATYEPNFGMDAISYNTTRTNAQIALLVNRDQQTTWNLQCNFKTGPQVLSNSPGTWLNQTAVWYYNQTYSVNNSTGVYIQCYDGASLLLNLVGFNTNRIAGGITLLNDTFDSWLGVPVAMIFVLFVAGMFSGRTAPTGILLILAMIGVMGFIGLLTISNTIWAFVLLAGTLGIFIGKRFL